MGTGGAVANVVHIAAKPLFGLTPLGTGGGGTTDVLRRLGACPTDDAARRAVERALERR